MLFARVVRQRLSKLRKDVPFRIVPCVKRYRELPTSYAIVEPPLCLERIRAVEIHLAIAMARAQNCENGGATILQRRLHECLELESRLKLRRGGEPFDA